MATATAGPRATQSHLADAELAELRRLLETERDRLQELYRMSVEREREIGYEDVEDTLDDVAKDIGREMLFERAESEREQLRLIDEALTRMDDGRYGLCLQTGKPIPIDRLRAVPWARFLAPVQAEVELGG